MKFPTRVGFFANLLFNYGIMKNLWRLSIHSNVIIGHVTSRVESVFETDRSGPGPERKDSFLWSQFIKSSI
jgi:hypothetical protein